MDVGRGAPSCTLTSCVFRQTARVAAAMKAVLRVARSQSAQEGCSRGEGRVQAAVSWREDDQAGSGRKKPPPPPPCSVPQPLLQQPSAAAALGRVPCHQTTGEIHDRCLLRGLTARLGPLVPSPCALAWPRCCISAAAAAAAALCISASLGPTPSLAVAHHRPTWAPTQTWTRQGATEGIWDGVLPALAEACRGLPELTGKPSGRIAVCRLKPTSRCARRDTDAAGDLRCDI